MNAPYPEGLQWQAAARPWFVNHLTDEGLFVAVVEVNHEIMATAMGAIRDCAPSPACPSGGDILISHVRHFDEPAT